MKGKKRYLFFIAVGLGLFFIVSGFMNQSQAVSQDPAQKVLARVEITGNVQGLKLPVFAHLQDKEGKDYALVMASLPDLEKARVSYSILRDPATLPEGQAYLIGLYRTPEASQGAARLISILHDEGRHLIAIADPDQVDGLVALGIEITWLSEEPLVLEPRFRVEPQRVDYNPTVAEIINTVTQDKLYGYEEGLTGVKAVLIGGTSYTIKTRNTNQTTPISKATQYMYEFMQNLGLSVSYHSWTSGSYSSRNVIGTKTGTVNPLKIILITAHLDDAPLNSAIAPGADDNGSGSVAVMLAAEIMSKYQFEKTIRFVFFTGEEQGLYGSKAYATKVVNDGDQIEAVYNMDMIAWDNVGGPVLELHTRQTSDPGYTGDLAIANTFISVVDTYNLKDKLTPSIKKDGISASDHKSFWDKGFYGILAIEDYTNDFDDYYHTANDTLDTLNMVYFTNYTKASLGTAAHLAVPVTPAAGEDFVGSFSNLGVWVRNSGTKVWSQWTQETASILAAGDLDGNGKEDMVGVFDYGLWVRMDNGTWQKITEISSNPTCMAVGDLNGDSKDDIIGSWAGIGVWVRYSGSNTWAQVFNKDALMLGSGDFDKDGKDDLLGVWDPEGIWIKYATGTWSKVADKTDLVNIAAGDMNGDGQAEFVGNFTHGVWMYDFAAKKWTKLHDGAEKVSTGDLNGDKKDDLFGTWKNVTGVWVQYSGTGTWEKLHDTKPVAFTAGKMR